MIEKEKKIIGIIGKKRSGKNTIGDYLVKNHNYVEYALANPIKYAIMAMFGFTNNQLWGSEEDRETIDPRWGISPRRMMQIIGTELFQYDIHKHTKEGELPFGKTIWVHKFKLWYEEELIKNPNIKVVITDIRFKHELEALKELNAYVIKTIRPESNLIDEHISEKELEDLNPDEFIINDGTLEELYKKIEDII